MGLELNGQGFRGYSTASTAKSEMMNVKFSTCMLLFRKISESILASRRLQNNLAVKFR